MAIRRSPYIRNRSAWRAYNENRIKRAYEINPEAAKIAFEIVPFLLHANTPGLPGYVDTVEPVGGVARYQPAEEVTQLIRKTFPAANLADARARAATEGFPIESLLLMGSIGTVSQTRASDFDYWVVYREKAATPPDLARLKSKLDAVERWGAENKVEIHFFLCDVERTRANDFGATNKESAGSSQAQSLKEEFYRTAILVAGKDPLWWVLPPRLTNEEYEESKSDLLLEGDLDETELVDLGNVESIPPGELFGALLWQFNKATASPYKAALKMALLESVINSGAGEPLLCDILKGAIHDHPDKTDQADPYLLMFDFVRRHYLRSKRNQTARALEKCFFLKSMDAPLTSPPPAREPSYKERTLRACMSHWKWEASDQDEINRYVSGGLAQAAELGSEIQRFMIDTYKDLHDLAKRAGGQSHITQNDLTVLGRKLFALYDRRDPAKVEQFKRVMNELRDLDAITFAVSAKRGAAPAWGIYRGDIRGMLARGGDPRPNLLRKGADPLHLMTWLTVNSIYHKGTFLHYVPVKDIPVALNELQQIMALIHEKFPPVDLGALRNEELMARAYVRRVFVTLNLQSFRWAQEIETVSMIYTTSWGETFCVSLPAKAGLPKLLDILAQTPSSFSLQNRDHFEVFAPKGDNETRLLRRLREFLAKRHKPTAPGGAPIL